MTKNNASQPIVHLPRNNSIIDYKQWIYNWNMAINVNKIYYRQNIIFIISDINYQLSYI